MLSVCFHANVLRVKGDIIYGRKICYQKKRFKKLEKYAENIHNTAVVIDYFYPSTNFKTNLALLPMIIISVDVH